MTPRRPRLAPVLAHLTDTDPAFWAVHAGDVLTLSSEGVATDRVPLVRWITRNPAKAYEVLQTRGLIPMGYEGRFLHEEFILDSLSPEAGGTSGLHAVARPYPTSLPDLVAWASLGFASADDGTPGIVAAEELAALYGYPLAWEVGPWPEGIGETYRPGTVGKRLRDAGIGTWLSGGLLCLAVPPLTAG